MTTRRRTGAACVAFLVTLLAACAAHRPPVVPALAVRAERVPVVLVPGITGTGLVRRSDDQVVWGDGHSLLFPRDGAHSTALPLTEGVQPEAVPGEVILRLRLLGGLIRKAVYGPVVELMEANGYRLGDLRDPRPEDTFFLFAYDWRKSGVDAAAALVARLEALRVARGEERLTVDLVVQSNAAQIGRYLVRYGGASLEEAESGTAHPPERISVRKMIFVGSANGGSIRVLQEMNRGRRYIPLVGRKLQPEVFFTYRSLYEALPHGDDLFVGPDGATLDVDLYDPRTWERLGWSIYAPDALARALEERHVEVFVDRGTIDRHLAQALDRSGRLDALLRTDPVRPIETRYYVIGNDRRETPARAVIDCDGDGACVTLFPDDRRVRRDPRLRRRTTEPGDGHATRRSQEALPPAERDRIAAPPVIVDDRHFELILEPAAQRRMLQFLAE